MKMEIQSIILENTAKVRLLGVVSGLLCDSWLWSLAPNNISFPNIHSPTKHSTYKTLIHIHTTTINTIETAVELVHKNTRCTKDNNICQNGGTCKSVVDEIDPCDCPSGYVGRMCEFFEPSVPKCSLKCQHGGSCRYGTKTENHTLVLNEPNGPEEQNIQVLHQDFQYCECPSGFLGTLCETEDTLCGDIKCRHGSTCITIEDNGKTDYRCDCNEVNQKKLSNKEDVQFAG